MRPSDNREDAIKIYLENVCGQHSPADYAVLLITRSADPQQLPTRPQRRLDAQAKNGYHRQNDKRSLTKTAVSTKVFTSCLNRPGMPWTRGPSSAGNTGRHAWNQQLLHFLPTIIL